MFGSTNGTANQPNPARPAASDVARIEGTLTQIIVTGDTSIDLALFVNGEAYPEGDVESLTIDITAPASESDQGAVTAILSRYETGPTGARTTRTVSLFPGTVELIARRRRIVVTCVQPGSFDGLWLGLGLRADGTSSELSGVQSLRLAVAPGLVDAKLTWSEDGTTENLLPST